MTEAEWLASIDPDPMLDFLRGKASDRKLRLFACACVRRVWLRMEEAVVPEEVEKSERFADGEASKQELRAARSQLGARGGYSAAWAANNALHAVLESEAEVAARRAISHAADFLYFLTIEEKHPALSENRGAAVAAREVERRELTDVVREVFGNPFRPQSIESSWLTWNDETVVRLSEAIYEARAFDQMPILADALQDAGCHDTKILNHCRQPGPHVRGCWIIDMLLNKR